MEYEKVVVYCLCVILFDVTLPNVLRQSRIRDSAHTSKAYSKRSHWAFVINQIR
jgi:hypothetical protein